MGMSDQQFEVYNALLNFVDELIDKEPVSYTHLRAHETS